MKLSDIRKLCDEASSAPWVNHQYIKCFSEDADARFIAASRDLIPKLLTVAEAAKKSRPCCDCKSPCYDCGEKEWELSRALKALENE